MFKVYIGETANYFIPLLFVFRIRFFSPFGKYKEKGLNDQEKEKKKKKKMKKNKNRERDTERNKSAENTFLERVSSSAVPN